MTLAFNGSSVGCALFASAKAPVTAMTERVRFHLDENVSNAIAEGLRRRGIDVTITPEASLISASDEEQLAFALAQNRVLVTHNDVLWNLP